MKLKNDQLINNMIKRIIYDINLNIHSTQNESKKIILFKNEKSNRSFNNGSPKLFKDKIKNSNKTFRIDNLNHNKNIECQIYVNKKPNLIIYYYLYLHIK